MALAVDADTPSSERAMLSAASSSGMAPKPNGRSHGSSACGHDRATRRDGIAALRPRWYAWPQSQL